MSWLLHRKIMTTLTKSSGHVVPGEQYFFFNFFLFDHAWSDAGEEEEVLTLLLVSAY